MEQLSGIQEQLNQIVEGQQLNVFAEGGAAVGVGAAAAGIVVGLLICFFGLKLVKFLGALVGFFVGALIGAVIALVAGLDGLAFAGVVVAAGVILAVLSWFLYRILGIASSILQPQSVVLTEVCAVAALVVAILAVIYVEPFVIIVTGLSGGVTAGTNIAVLAGLGENVWIGIGIGAVIAVIGIIVQFMMHSRRVGKKEKNFSEQVKEQDSMESEVEKMRHLLDDDDDDDLQD